MTREAPGTRRRERRGSVYVLVLALVLLVMAAGLAAVGTTRMRSRTISQGSDTMRAELLAESAVERAMTYINADANWRNTYNSGVETPQKTLGPGTVTFKLVDEVDGDLSNSSADPVRVYGIGRVGKSTQVFSVIASSGIALDCLGAAVCVGGDVALSSSTVVGVGMTMASNGSVSATTAVVGPRVEAVGAISGITYAGGTLSPAPARTLPAATVFDVYKANGNAINYNSIPSGVISNCLLSPTNNPFGGGTNAQGIYVIDCQNNDLQITTCRIVGTLVLLNAGAGSCVQTKVLMEPAVSNFPCLMVQGPFTLKTNSVALSEGGVVNFNPAGCGYPYPGGSTNINMTDSYPNVINGLVYVSGNLTTNSNPAVHSLVVGGTWTAAGTLTLSYTNRYLLNPPPGFGSLGNVAAVPGSWRREQAP